MSKPKVIYVGQGSVVEVTRSLFGIRVKITATPPDTGEVVDTLLGDWNNKNRPEGSQ